MGDDVAKNSENGGEITYVRTGNAEGGESASREEEEEEERSVIHTHTTTPLRDLGKKHSWAMDKKKLKLLMGDMQSYATAVSSSSSSSSS